MNRTSGSHKLKDSLATNNHTTLVQNLMQYPFSMNMYKCLSRNNKKVFSILVSFYDEEKERSVVKVYDTIDCVDNAQVLFNSITNLFECDSILVCNSCSSFRHSRSILKHILLKLLLVYYSGQTI